MQKFTISLYHIRKNIKFVLFIFSLYMSYVKKLRFEEKPDYRYLRGLFSTALEELNILPENLYLDWIKVNN